MATNGWIKLHRSLLDWEWYHDTECFRVFSHLLLTCNWEEKKWEGMVVKSGQRIVGISELSREIGLTERVLRTRLTKLEKTGEIAKQSTNKGTVITVLNWPKYQGFDEVSPTENDEDAKQMPSKRQANAKRLPTTKERKKERKKEISQGAAPLQEDPSFNSIENMKTEQRMDSLTRWDKVLTIWNSREADYILKASREKYWMTYSKEFQEEMVSYLQGLGPKAVHLQDLWISVMMKNKLFHPGQIQTEVDKKHKQIPKTPAPSHLKNDGGNF